MKLIDSPQVSEGHLELQLLLGQRLHLLDEVLEGGLELVPHLALHLLGVQVVPVVHVLVFAQVCGDLPDLRVELDVRVPPLAKHDGVLGGATSRSGCCHKAGTYGRIKSNDSIKAPYLQVEVQNDDHLAVTRLEDGVFNVVIKNVHFVASD